MIPDEHDLRWITERVTSHYRATAIYLFGSHAKGTGRHDSDIDLLIIGPSRLPPERRGKEVAAALAAFPAGFDLLFHTEEELAEACADPYSFLASVLPKARTLYRHQPAQPARQLGEVAGHG
jgi:predicted nucleotidyltransferase